jgi:rhamnulokinase
MAELRRVAANDLGAERGRVVVGELDGESVTMRLVHRFENRPLRLPDGLHWNLPQLFAQTLTGLRAAAADGPLDGIGVDTWGCDYALLDDGLRMLGLPFHHRDGRTGPAVVAATHARVARDELYRVTGIQTMPINTVFQLCAERDSGAAALAGARRIALIPDLIGLWLTGALANELTVASTTGLLPARGRHWSQDVVARLGLPAGPFAGETVEPATQLGPVLAVHREAAGDGAGVPVRTVAAHDTGSAFAAAPLTGPHGAVLSSGTWSLLGVELDAPILDAQAAAFNLTNERGIGGTVRLLRNVMGLWLVQECRRAWETSPGAVDYEGLEALAAGARPDVALFDPDHESLLRGGEMPARISALCRAGDQPEPDGRGELIRAILVSLACKYRLVLEQLEAVTRRRLDVVHVVGGGARNQLLCRLTADLLGREVLAGPVEATALGNVLVQAMALGELSDLAQLRVLAARAAAPERYEPGDAALAQETYDRFLEVTGLGAARPLRSPVQT